MGLVKRSPIAAKTSTAPASGAGFRQTLDDPSSSAVERLPASSQDTVAMGDIHDEEETPPTLSPDDADRVHEQNDGVPSAFVELKKKRCTLRSRLTRLTTDVETKLNACNDSGDLQSKIDGFVYQVNDIAQQLATLDTDILPFVDQLWPSQRDAEIANEDKYQDLAASAAATAERFRQSAQQQSQATERPTGPAAQPNPAIADSCQQLLQLMQQQIDQHLQHQQEEMQRQQQQQQRMMMQQFQLLQQQLRQPQLQPQQVPTHPAQQAAQLQQPYRPVQNQTMMIQPAKPPTVPRFSGDKREFRRWWQLYKLDVHDQPYSDIEKYRALTDALRGPAARCIRHLDFLPEQYALAVDTLRKEFGREDDAATTHLEDINRACASGEAVSNHPPKFSSFVTTITVSVKALSALGKSYDGMSTYLVPKIVACLARQQRESFSRLQLNNAGLGAKTDIELLLEFLEEESMIKTRSEVSAFKGTTNRPPHSNQPDRQPLNKNGQNRFGGHAKQSNSNYGPARDQFSFFTKTHPEPECIFCEKKHDSSKCRKKMSNEERRQLVAKARVCFRCLRPNHSANKCRSRQPNCQNCQGRHLPMVCPKPTNNNNTDNTNSAGSTGNSGTTTTLTHNTPTNPNTSTTLQSLTTPDSPPILLQTGLVYVTNGRSDRKLIRLLLDSGSQRSYVSSKIVDWLGASPTKTESLMTFTIGGEVSEIRQFDIHNIQLQSRFDDSNTISVSCLHTPIITGGTLPVSTKSYGLDHVADLMDGDPPRSIEILLGADTLPRVCFPDSQIFGNIHAVNTMFGWFLHGKGVSEEQIAEAVAALGVLRTIHAFTTITSDQPDQIQRSSDEKPPLNDIEFLWSTDSFGSEDSPLSEKDAKLLEHFRSTIYRGPDGHYVISLPFNENIQALADNEGIARARLMRLLKNLKNNPPLLAAFDTEIANCVAHGYAEPAQPKQPGQPTHYLPLLAVVKSTTASAASAALGAVPEENPPPPKLRVVKDAGCRIKNAASLNDVLHQGPNLLPDLVKVLMRFRKDPIAITADIEKAFQQFRIEPKQRSFLRFLWPLGITHNPNAPIREFQAASLDFGLNASPYLNIAGLKYHLESEQAAKPNHAEFIDDVANHFYVDDVVTTAQSLTSAKERARLLKDIFDSGRFTLKKWATNSTALGNHLLKTLPAGTSVSFNDKEFKFLGVLWDQTTDTLGVQLSNAIQCLQTNTPSKRTLLRAVAQLYDPLGIISPISTEAKVLLQTLWVAKVDWDSALTDAHLSKFASWLDTLVSVSPVRIPRACEPKGKVVRRELHTFCDASLSAYGCVVYLRTLFDNNKVDVLFICSRGRVRPVASNLTIHRLELLGATLAVRTLANAKEHISLHIDEVIFWTDNAAVLGWVKSDPSRWKPYVANRVGIIHQLSNADQWRYIRSEENPADLLSRADPLSSNDTRRLWLLGPSWLSADGRPGAHALDPAAAALPVATHLEERPATAAVASLTTTSSDRPPPPIAVDGARCGSWPKAVRAMAYVLRIVQRRREQTITISAAEYARAEIELIKTIQSRHYGAEIKTKCVNIPASSHINQFRPFLDDFSIIRCNTRLLKNKDLTEDEKQPILLPADDDLVKLLIQWVHGSKCLHSGGVAHTLHHLRSKYFIPRARRAVRKTIARCAVCTRYVAKPAQEVTPPLPAHRLEQAAPFTCSGTDFAGPILVRNDAGDKTKSYIVLFVCAVTRAVHIELVPNLSTIEFLMAFRRFFNRRPSVAKLISDNGRTLVRAAKELALIFEHIRGAEMQALLGEKSITWEFVTERAPWHAGWYERMVACIKRPLRKIIGSNCVHYRTLETILTDIEAMVNSRPLTAVTTDPNEVRAFCPADLLYGYRGRLPLPETSRLPASIERTNPNICSQRWKQQQSTLNAFWKRFRTEYLQYLRSLHVYPNVESRPLRVGDVCLLIDPAHPSRSYWPICRVIELSGGERTDLRQRSCKIKMGTGQIYKRPINLLYKLELDN